MSDVQAAQLQRPALGPERPPPNRPHPAAVCRRPPNTSRDLQWHGCAIPGESVLNIIAITFVVAILFATVALYLLYIVEDLRGA